MRVEIKVDTSGIPPAEKVELSGNEDGVAQPVDLTKVGLASCGEGL